MIHIASDRIAEIKRRKHLLEKKLKVKIEIKGPTITIEAEPLDEFEASRVFEAINLGFSVETALTILEEDIVFEKLNLKDYTRRKDLEIVRGRLIGTHGKTKDTLEEITGSEIKVKDNYVGIIGHGESITNTITAVTNIIRGSKQANAYKFLERINTRKKKVGF